VRTGHGAQTNTKRHHRLLAVEEKQHLSLPLISHSFYPFYLFFVNTTSLPPPRELGAAVGGLYFRHLGLPSKPNTQTKKQTKKTGKHKEQANKTKQNKKQTKTRISVGTRPHYSHSNCTMLLIVV